MAHQLESLQLDELSADPGTPPDGKVWYNTTAGKLRARINGQTKDLAEGSGGGWPYSNVITVDPSDPDADYSTITAAVNAASDGDIILVSPGDYNETGIYITKELAIVGLVPPVPSPQAGSPFVHIYGTVSSDEGSVISRDPLAVEIVLANLWINMTWTGSSGTGYAIDGNAAEWRLQSCYVRVDVDTGAGSSSNVYGASLQRGFVNDCIFLVYDPSDLITSGFKRPLRQGQFSVVDDLEVVNTRVKTSDNSPGDLYVTGSFSGASLVLKAISVEGTLINSGGSEAIYLESGCYLNATSGTAPTKRYEIGDVVDDTTPQLGGDLDCNDKDIIEGVTISFVAEYDNGSWSGTAALDWNNGQKQRATLSGNVTTLNIAVPPGPGNFLLKIIQGSSDYTITWPSSVKWPGGNAPALSSGAGAIDIMTFYYDGTNYYGVASLDFQ